MVFPRGNSLEHLATVARFWQASRRQGTYRIAFSQVLLVLAFRTPSKHMNRFIKRFSAPKLARKNKQS
eukprot:scaffold25830_cov162-Cylindrotheca_fusiformis.AAC.18